MKRIMTLALAAAMVFGAATGASAIEFKASGQWLVGIGAGEGNFVGKYSDTKNGTKKHTDQNDIFSANQRLRLKLDAVASEALSGTVYFEIGDQPWGKASSGAALGADGMVVEVKNAYIDWLVPNTDLSVRMGIQPFELPNAAGGSAVASTDSAGITASYKVNDNVSVTALWMRPVNDSYDPSYTDGTRNYKNYLDNMDLFALSLPLNFDGISVTPWVMYGAIGKNALWDKAGNDKNGDIFVRPVPTVDGSFVDTLYNFHSGLNRTGAVYTSSKSYGSMFWVGLPIKVTALDPWNIEFDANYGYVEKMGRFDVAKRGNINDVVRASTEREGWVVKGLVEYKMDWGTPGIFAWYGSGDDGNVKNGSERMPNISPFPSFTNMMGGAGLDWGSSSALYEKADSFDGSWGVGFHLKDMSFMEDLKHTFIVAYRGGTNSPSMVKYMDSSIAWNDAGVNNGAVIVGPYLTTNDGLLEFNLMNSYQIYENLAAHFELGYIVNMVDKDTWQRSYIDDRFTKQDAWKVNLSFAYSF